MEEKEKKEKEETVVIAPVEEEKKSHKKRAILLLLLLLITGFLLTTSTYAWFTSNTNVQVSNIQVNVSTQNGIQLSADAINWKSIISTTDLKSAYTTYTAATNQLPETMEPVSTALNIENDYFKMFYGIVDTNDDGDYIITAEDVSTVSDNSTNGTGNDDGDGTKGKFVMFDLFFKLDGTKDTITNIYMTSGSNVTVPGSDTDTGIKNASRVAFINLGETESSNTAATAQAITGGTDKYLWEPNYDFHTATGVNNAVQVYKMSADTVKTGADNERIAYDGINSVIEAADNVKLGEANSSHGTAGTKFTTVTPSYTTKASFTGDEYVDFFTLKAGYVTKVRVYFWIEGQDVDCENGASGGNIVLNLAFSTKQPGSDTTGN